MRKVPLFAALITAAGLIPFIYGALLTLGLPAHVLLQGLVPNWDAPDPLLFSYGEVVLSALSGVYFGFATLARRRWAPLCYLLAVLPALYVFLLSDTLIAQLWGFIGVLVLDLFFWWRRLSPGWWLRYRLSVTAIIVACLGVGVWL